MSNSPAPTTAPTLDAERPRLPAGDPSRHRPLAALQAGFAALPAPPADAGSVALLVRRLPDGGRETPERVRLTQADGLPGDRWKIKVPLDPNAQLTLMRRDIGDLVANGQPLTHFGDNLLVDLDLSDANLPPGTRLRIGEAEVEVTPKPHTGCLKYRGRFGGDALRFVSTRDALAANLRGVHVQVIVDGKVALGDAIHVLGRPNQA